MLKLDSNSVRLWWSSDSPNNLLGDDSVTYGISRPRFMMAVGWARVITVEIRNGLIRDTVGRIQGLLRSK